MWWHLRVNSLCVTHFKGLLWQHATIDSQVYLRASLVYVSQVLVRGSLVYMRAPLGYTAASLGEALTYPRGA